MKTILTLFFLSSSMLTYGQAKIDKVPPFEYFVITEAYFIRNDTTYNIDKEFIEQRSGISFIPMNDSIIIGIDHGGKDKTEYIGYGKKIKGIINRTYETEEYSWLYISPEITKPEKASIHKVYDVGGCKYRCSFS
jgi:hypothetical protein